MEDVQKTAVGNLAPDFTLNDIEGRPISLSAFRGQYVLIDFWASWCSPCRQENPAMAAIHRLYHSKGFTILGVSLDDEKELWEAAIREDQLDWVHVSDLKGWVSLAADLYEIRGIPMNFLVDRNGRIIARGMRGADLEKKLAETLQ